MGLLCAASLLVGCAYPRESEIPVAKVSDLKGPHVDADGRFVNPWAEDPKTVWGMLRWQLFTKNPYRKMKIRPKSEIEVGFEVNDGAYLGGVERSASVTWVGHSTFAVHDRDDVFLTDPHFGKHALIPRRKFPPGIPVESVPADAFAVVSHNHYDHLDAPTIKALARHPGIAAVVPLKLGGFLKRRGHETVHELDWGDTVAFDEIEVTALPAVHFSRRGPFDGNRTLWASYAITGPGRHTGPPSEEHHARGVVQRNRKDNQRSINADGPLPRRRIGERRQDRKHTDQQSNRQAAGIAQKNRRRMHVERKEPGEGPDQQPTARPYEKLDGQHGRDRENPRRDQCDAACQPVHVVEKIERIGDTHNP